MEGGEDGAWANRVGDAGVDLEGSASRADADELAVLDVEHGGVGGVDFEEGLGLAAIELGDETGAGHGVPLVFGAAGE